MLPIMEAADESDCVSLPKAVAFSDPISAVFELNDEMLERMSRIGYVVKYSFWAGALLALLAGGYLVYSLFEGPADLLILFALSVITIVSVTASWYARGESPFLEEYKVISSAISRARRWEPHPKLPEGKDPGERLVNYLKSVDERFEYWLEREPECLRRNAQVKGKGRKAYGFDLVFERPLLSTSSEESVRILVRTVKTVTVDDVKNIVKDVQAVLDSGSDVGSPARAILLQTGGKEMSQAAIEHANSNWVKYSRDLGNMAYDWESPVELIAEDPSGVYSFGSFYFG